MPHKTSSRPVVIISVRPEIPSVLRDYLNLFLPLLLILLDLFILIDAVHELAHAPN